MKKRYVYLLAFVVCFSSIMVFDFLTSEDGDLDFLSPIFPSTVNLIMIYAIMNMKGSKRA